MVDAVGEAERQVRENALPKARDSARERVPEKEEAALLGALAGLVESIGELAGAVGGRVTNRGTARTYTGAGRRLRSEAGNLRGDEDETAARSR
ncbi:hypothetical protein DR950_10720 [Kitasatospora xanthocidica]|uniref:Uncharacterized protein n=2 Tax=Kitasatospora xanthocidica TaxID=83382 RepID=A0A372ZQM8_9ACTN|nr:hypothetical protein DR950_10720 [Kitasatospora xanthocidica]